MNTCVHHWRGTVTRRPFKPGWNVVMYAGEIDDNYTGKVYYMKGNTCYSGVETYAYFKNGGCHRVDGPAWIQESFEHWYFEGEEIKEDGIAFCFSKEAFD